MSGDNDQGTAMSKGFASSADNTEKKLSFTRIGSGLYAFTAEGDPNSGVIVGDDAVMVVDAQATPMMAREVIDRVAKITDKPIRYVLLSHYHAVRVLGASAYTGAEILASDTTRGLIAERGQADMDSEIGRFPRLFRAVETIPGLTWPTLTFPTELSVWLGNREVRIMHLGRAHTAGDVVAFVPDAGVVFSGTSPNGRLVEIIELRDHPFFVGSQFHPEFRSRPGRPHPLFRAFMVAATKGLNAEAAAPDSGAASAIPSEMPTAV